MIDFKKALENKHELRDYKKAYDISFEKVVQRLVDDANTSYEIDELVDSYDVSKTDAYNYSVVDQIKIYKEYETLLAYETYKKDWVKEHIDDDLMARTKAHYENDADNMTFEQFVEEYGYADGSCYSCYEEFKDNEFPAIKLTDRIEQFMYERGEYDFSDKIRWIADSREDTANNIFVDIFDEPEALVNYLSSEIATIDCEDELLPVAEKLFDELKTYSGYGE